MAGRYRFAAAALLAFGAPGLCGAQQLQRLHVASVALTADTQAPRVRRPFDVTVTIHVADRVNRLDGVYLPSVAGAQAVGQERQLQSGASGTTYRATLRLIAEEGGELVITPAYVDAIDARDGKPKRFLSNSLRLKVTARESIGRGPRWTAVLLVCFLPALAACASLLILRRLPRRETVVAAAAPPAACDMALETALASLRTQPTRSAVLEVRRVLWRRIGAQSGQTLCDVLGQNRSLDPGHRMLLAGVESATFVEEAQLQAVVGAILRCAEPES